MTIYERIRNRRKELGLSADDVASDLGISRATLYRYESSDIEKLPASIIGPLSKILQTTPAYLMGWEKCDENFYKLSESEITLINFFRDLNSLGKEEALKRINELTRMNEYTDK